MTRTRLVEEAASETHAHHPECRPSGAPDRRTTRHLSPVGAFRPGRRLNGRIALAAGLAVLSILALLVGLSIIVPDTQTVLQATRDLPAGVTVQPEDVAAVKVRLPDTMAQTAYDGTAVDQVVGRRTGVRISAGQLLGPSDFTVRHTSVAPGRVQVTISVDAYTASGGAIGPGDTVIVYASPRQQGGILQAADILVDQARVVGVGRADQAGVPAGTSSTSAASSKPLWLTLDLDPDQGARVTAAARTQYVDIVDQEAVAALLAEMRAEFDRRLLAGPSAARPELVLVVGELVDLAPYVGLLGQVGERGASCGIRLLAASTRPGSELAAHPLLPDFGTRLIQRTADEDESLALLGTADAAYLGGGGRLLFRSEQRTPVDLYAYHVAPPDLERLVEVMTVRYGATPGRHGGAETTSSTMPEGHGLERGPEPGSGLESDEPAAEPDDMAVPADRLQLEHWAKAKGRHNPEAAYEAMRALYVGDLFDRAAAQPYAWAVDPGPDGVSLVQEYRQMYQEVTRILAERYAATADDPQRTERALELYDELVRLDPANERLWSALFRLHARLGDRVALERDWRRLCQVLQEEEPGTEPRGTTRDLYQQLLGSLEQEASLR